MFQNYKINKLFILLLLIPFILDAQEKKKGLLEQMVSPKVSFQTTIMDRGTINNSEGGVELNKNSIKINNANLSFSYTNWQFDWNNVDDLPFGDKVSQPIEEMHSLSLGVSKAYRLDQRWFSLSSASINATFEDSLTDSYNIGLFSFASYAIDSDHSLQVGFFGTYHPVKTIALPIISYSYRARSRDGVQVIIGFPRTYIGYHINQDTLIRVGATASNSLIRLSNTSTIEKEGYSKFEDYMVNLGISYDYSNKLKLTGDLLYTVQRDFTIYDKNGNELNNYEMGSSKGVMLKAILQF